VKIAVACKNGKISEHFGGCYDFALVEVDIDHCSIEESKMETAPEHEPGLLPRWLTDRDVEVVIAGGMGRRAQELLKQQGIEIILGAAELDWKDAIEAYLHGELAVGENRCRH